MLSLANVSAAHGANYFKIENYYSEKDSVGFSRWAGKDAAKFGLVGAVDHNQFSHLLKGTDAAIQVAGNMQNRKRAGLDMICIPVNVGGDSSPTWGVWPG